MGGRRGRGGGRRGGNRGGGRGGRPAHVLAPSGDTSIILLKADLEFWERVADKACPASIIEGADDKQGVQLKLESWKDLGALLGWFTLGLSADAAAELSFSPKLNKTQRALVHSGAEDAGRGALDSVSRGTGEQRYVTVLKKGRAEAQRVALNEKQEHKAYWLWRWAQQGGFEVSRDEVAEMVRDDALKAELQQLWASKSAQQKAVQQLCAAAAAGDLAGVRAAVEAAPGALAEGVFDVQTGVAPLHMAAKTGQLPAMELLLELGAGLEWQDGAGLTALQISRKFDQSDAEGLLLRAGARDPDARNWPGEAAPAAPVASGGAAAGAAAARPTNGQLTPAAVASPRSVAASEGGDSESFIDSAASVCGTDVSRNVGDVSSIAGDTVAESEVATSPRAPALEAVGEHPLEYAPSEGSGDREEGEGGKAGSEGPAAAEAAEVEVAATVNGGSADSEGGGVGELGSGSGGPPSSSGGPPSAPASERGRDEALHAAVLQAGMLRDYLSGGRLSGGSERKLDNEDLESTRSVCGSEMTYQHLVDVGISAADPLSQTGSPSAAATAAHTPAALEAPVAAATVAAPAAAAAGAEPAPEAPSAVAAAALRQRHAAGSSEIRPAGSEGAEALAAPAGAKSKGAGAAWELTGVAQVDAAISEWAEWASSNKGVLLAGAGVMVGAALVLGLGGGSRRRF